MSAQFPPPDDASFDDAAVEALLSGAGDPADPLTAALRALRSESGRAVPEPSPALAELFGDVPPPDELSRRRRAARITISVVVAGTATLALSGVAAAHDALPGAAQGVVTDIVNDLTPFHIGREERLSRLPVLPAAPTDTSVPGVGTGPSPTGEDRPSGHPSDSSGTGRSDDRSGDRHGGGSGDGSDGDGSGGGSGDGSHDGSGSGGGGSDDGDHSGATSGSGDGGGGDSDDGGSDGGGGGGSDDGGGSHGGGGSDDGGSASASGGSDGGGGH